MVFVRVLCPYKLTLCPNLYYLPAKLFFSCLLIHFEDLAMILLVTDFLCTVVWLISILLCTEPFEFLNFISSQDRILLTTEGSLGIIPTAGKTDTRLQLYNVVSVVSNIQTWKQKRKVFMLSLYVFSIYGSLKMLEYYWEQNITALLSPRPW